MSCCHQPGSGCPTRPSPPEGWNVSRQNHCPPNSSKRLCIVPPIDQKPHYKPCCVRLDGFPCKAHQHPHYTIRFSDADIAMQY